MELETEELNWAGNLEYRASELLYPTSIEQLQEQVRAASRRLGLIMLAIAAVFFVSIVVKQWLFGGG